MIPFGCKTPILSIISHDKLAWFLEDINHPEWGVDVMDNDFESKLYSCAINMLNTKKTVYQQMSLAQDNLWTITNNNLQTAFNC